MSNISKWSFVLVTLVVFNSCKTLPTAPSGTATIDGRVLLAQTYWILTPPYNGVTVSIEGTSFSAVSDDSGYYTFQGVPTGTYNVHFSKPGYGEIYWMSETVTGGGDAPQYWYTPQWSQTMYKVSNAVTVLNSVTMEDTTLPYTGKTSYLVAKGNVTPDSSLPQYFQSMAVYVSHTSDVSDIPGHYATYFFESQIASGYNLYPFDTTLGTFTFGISQYILSNVGFNLGDSIYVAAYGSPTYGASMTESDYYDPATKQYVLSALNPTPSHVIGAVMP